MKLLENVREVFKTLKHRQPARIYCPRCCSPKISLYSSLDIWLTPKKYVCNECGYVGPIVMELEKEKERVESA
jgi:transcription elongation factor Elf1